MHPKRWHITGASGTGTTTLGRALAQSMAVPAMDTDDFYWRPTAPPYGSKRPISERLGLMQSLFLPRPAWVLSGSLCGWGDPIVPYFDAVVFLSLDKGTRLARLASREATRCDAPMPAGDGALSEVRAGFLDWAARYDDPAFIGRSRAMHEAWLERLTCPVLRLDSTQSVDSLLRRCLDWKP